MADGAGAVADFRCELAIDAYSKILSHAVKYPMRPVSGIIIGTEGKDGATTLEDAIPLFHSYPMGPMLELAMMQVEEYSKKKEKKIVGCYWANELLDDHSIHKTAKRIGAQIAKYFPKACILLVDNKRIGKDKKTPVVAAFLGSDGSSSVPLAGPPEKDLDSLHKEPLKSKIVDFDDHLDDLSADWLHQSA